MTTIFCDIDRATLLSLGREGIVKPSTAYSANSMNAAILKKEVIAES